MSTIILLLLAVVPGLAIALFIYLRDNREAEPYSQLLLNIFFGVVCFFMARGIGFLLHHFIYVGHENLTQQLLGAFVFVGLLGEGSKFLFLRGFTFYNKNFNQPFDGIVYAIMVGMGYATAENILYVINGDSDSAMLRIAISAPANAVFAVIMGYFLGEAKAFGKRNLLYSVLALLLAAFAHGYYDYFLTVMNIHGLWMQAIISLILAAALTLLAFKRQKNESIKTNDQ